uniref:NAD(P)-binding domain-containing protein n=1 Tax=Sexangularia sp. CB-2014 TaxID=1486929 RepID=A0A7S1YAI6_9EUKA|mmetsp:Transcript_13207/g.41621  ORF Transcript_13207/g.41621 Transcript_13207/m.41621 type:complete len:250 (+) Transcript_13207:52-801(+)
MVKTLVLGASGATGKQVCTMLHGEAHPLHLVVRQSSVLPTSLTDAPNVTVHRVDFLGMSDEAVADLVGTVDAVVSCLGHTLSLSGMYGAPRDLVTQSVRRIVTAARASHRRDAPPLKLVLMNTSGNRNPAEDKQVGLAERAMLGIIRTAVPPHADNEGAAAFLRSNVPADDSAVQWVVVRPDSLVDEDTPSGYEAHPSPLQSAIFGSGKVSRANVGRFMADLITKPTLWEKWANRMPILYNKDQAKTEL